MRGFCAVLLLLGLAYQAASISEISWSSLSYSVNEDAGSVQVSILRKGEASDFVDAASVEFVTDDGTAATPADYAYNAGVVSWANGQSATRNLTIPIVWDTLGESDEQFTLRLRNARGGAQLGFPALVPVWIVNVNRPNTTTSSTDQQGVSSTAASSTAAAAVTESSTASSSSTAQQQTTETASSSTASSSSSTAQSSSSTSSSSQSSTATQQQPSSTGSSSSSSSTGPRVTDDRHNQHVTTPAPATSSDGLSRDAMIGIAVAAALGFVLIVGTVFIIVSKARDNNRPGEDRRAGDEAKEHKQQGAEDEKKQQAENKNNNNSNNSSEAAAAVSEHKRSRSGSDNSASENMELKNEETQLPAAVLSLRQAATANTDNSNTQQAKPDGENEHKEQKADHEHIPRPSSDHALHGDEQAPGVEEKKTLGDSSV